MVVRASFLAILVGLSLASTAAAQGQAAGTDASALAKAAQNPLATLVTLPLQANYNLGVGPYDRTVFNLNIQPVVPFRGERWNFILRTIIPLNSVPQGEMESTFGFGDAVVTGFFSPAKASSATWGLGPVALLPSASNPEVLGSGKLGLGPSGVLFVSAGRFTVGGLVSNIWSVAGDSERDDVNLFTFQWFINLNLGGGLALGTVPIVTADWTAESGEQWTVPWGLQISKVTRVGAQPINVLFGYYWNSEHPTGGPEAQVRFQVNFMFPTGS